MTRLYPHRLGLAQLAQALDFPAPRAKPEPDFEPPAPVRRGGLTGSTRGDILIAGKWYPYAAYAACNFSADAAPLSEQLQGFEVAA